MSSFTVSVTAADTDRSSLIPSLQFHLSPAESTCKSNTTKPDRPNLTLIIPNDQDNRSSDSDESLFNVREYSSVAFKALRAQQFFRAMRGSSKEYLEGYQKNWESAKVLFSLLSVLARFHEECEEENDWPVEWVDAAAVTLFFETTVVAWFEELTDHQKVTIEELARYMGACFTVDHNSDAAIEEHQNRLRKWFHSMGSIPENDQWLEEYKDCVPIEQAFNHVG
ncbi:hypothetical protein FPHYL_12871 [Fusarium phyllophilum]|uniref:Uncharacterized protein n=1 Tax=Fusarium phyllophilum TaxID=47803 RepID=A0A8H5IGM0_9HYPO|nr:hypothetical protein FPHYL_12871 [Fusarium phyllophilum]